ncbi:MAG: tetratricopeptide repeat protein [Proteobacteria bacterium]|nr:tetratricopeptide repeat protein [Pseudomonadota bacterium]
MSLLMQALKKAEQAKQQTDEPSKPMSAEEKPAPTAPEELSLSPMETAGAPTQAPPADTAKLDEHPVSNVEKSASDIPPRTSPHTAALDIPPLAPLPSELSVPVSGAPLEQPSSPPPPQPASATAEPAAVPANKTSVPPESLARPAVSKPTLYSGTRPQPRESGAQQTAKAVFASKQLAHKNQGMRIALGAIVVLLLASAGFGYYYIQGITQKSSVITAGTPTQPPVPPDPALAAQQQADSTAIASTPATTASMIAAADSTAALSSGKLAGGQTVTASEPATPVKTLPADKLAIADTEQKAMPTPAANKSTQIGSAGITIRQTNNVDRINPTLASAYQAFVAGDTTSAQQKYQQVVQLDANNRDALLGLAAIALVHKQPAQAGAYYLKLLELDPADADAVAGMISLQQGNLAQNESHLKKIIVDNPNAVAVQFVLGNLYAQQSRWADAQQAYFQAFGGAPGNADYAFNLAVSLDRLSQTKLALEYYQRALALAQNGSGNFNKSAVQTRIRELQSVANN